ncbi:MAG: flagellar brake protein [Desulfarculus sp.]|nr:flagellar brake protein [Desulfarculus sp.]
MTDLEQIIANVNDGNRLQVELGTPLLLQLDGVESQLKSILVGMEPGCFIVIRAPKVSGVESKFFEGNQGIVRYLWAGTVFSFQSSVVGHINQPFPLLFLSYPRVVSRNELRKEPRYDCYIPATLITANNRLSGALLDISRNGCRFAARRVGKPQGGGPEIGNVLEVEARIVNGEPPEILAVVVRNIKKDANITAIGLSFQGLDTKALGALEGCIRTLEEAGVSRSLS